MLYSDKSLDFIRKINSQDEHENIIQKVANQLGLNPQLIAGAIVEEADSKNHNNIVIKWLDKHLDKHTVQYAEQQLRDDYKEVVDKGIINEKTGLAGIFNTFKHGTMRDVGFADLWAAGACPLI